jgi:hypothetical protein
MSDDSVKISRKGELDGGPRHIEQHINRERPAPQPKEDSRDMSREIEHEHAKRRN